MQGSGRKGRQRSTRCDPVTQGVIEITFLGPAAWPFTSHLCSLTQAGDFTINLETLEKKIPSLCWFGLKWYERTDRLTRASCWSFLVVVAVVVYWWERTSFSAVCPNWSIFHFLLLLECCHFPHCCTLQGKLPASIANNSRLALLSTWSANCFPDRNIFFSSVKSNNTDIWRSNWKDFSKGSSYFPSKSQKGKINKSTLELRKL